MTQLPIPFIDTKATALIFVRSSPGVFRPEFHDWLDSNWHVWQAFEAEANRVWNKGRAHYSARTIVHWLRHETVLSERGSEFKINNNYSPDLARLYAMIYPDRNHFFEYRLLPTGRRAA